MPGCGREMNKHGNRCGDVVGGVQELRCRPCAYLQDGEKEVRASWKKKTDAKKQKNGDKSRSKRRQANK